MSLTLRRLWIQLTSDRKRFGLLCAALVLGLLLWARLIIVSNMPRTAVANQPKGAPAAAGAPGSRAQAPGRALPSRRRQPVKIELFNVPTRDPFVISPRYFPKPTPLAELPRDTGKLPAQPVEDAQQIEARITEQLRALVDRMKLEGVMGSMAVISGRTYRVDDLVVAGNSQVSFRLIELKRRSVMLEYEDRRFELRMLSPGD